MTNETKQTAVEWFGIKMGKLFAQYHGKKICIGEFHRKRFELEEQANEMFKEQMIDAWSNGYDEEDRATSNPLNYYNETYGGNK